MILIISLVVLSPFSLFSAPASVLCLLPSVWCLLVLLSGHRYSLSIFTGDCSLMLLFVFTIQKASFLNLAMTNTSEELYLFYFAWYLLVTCHHTQTLCHLAYMCVFCKQNSWRLRFSSTQGHFPKVGYPGHSFRAHVHLHLISPQQAFSCLPLGFPLSSAFTDDPHCLPFPPSSNWKLCNCFYFITN